MKWRLIILLVLCKGLTVRSNIRFAAPKGKADTVVAYKRLPPTFDAYMNGKVVMYEGMRYDWLSDSRSNFGDSCRYVGETLYKAFDMSIDSLFSGLLPNMPVWTDSSNYYYTYSELNH